MWKQAEDAFRAETELQPGKAESQAGNHAAAEKAWKRVIEIEMTGNLASQAHFGLSGIYRKQGKAEDAACELKQFQDSRQPEKQP